MNEQKQRLKLRLAEIRNCKTPEELAFAIWSKKFEEATGSNKDAYRIAFINWIEHFVGATENNLIWTSYKTPRDLAEGIWQPFLDEPNDEWFPDLRTELVAWIFNYNHEFYYASKRRGKIKISYNGKGFAMCGLYANIIQPHIAKPVLGDGFLFFSDGKE